MFVFRRPLLACIAIAAAGALVPGTSARAFGAEGHLVAGRAAAGFLCRQAAVEVSDLGNDAGLGQLGLWADRIRRVDRYRHTAPWHYMNMPDDLPMERYASPPEGDVLSAIERHESVLADRSLSRADRAEALRFLTHFVVDIHQPLHVGRADDRGGNTIDVSFLGEQMNLHRVWDGGAFELTRQGLDQYARALAATIETSLQQEVASRTIDPRRWARESLVLRAAVYDFDRDSGALSAEYLDALQRITRERLALAAARLAATLNDALCN